MKMREAIDWAIDALQSRLDELGSGWTYDQTLEAARVLGDFKKDPLIVVSTEITMTYPLRTLRLFGSTYISAARLCSVLLSVGTAVNRMMPLRSSTPICR